MLLIVCLGKNVYLKENDIPKVAETPYLVRNNKHGNRGINDKIRQTESENGT